MTTTELDASINHVESRDPITGEVWRRFDHASREAVQNSVRAARAAQRAWSEVPIRERASAAERIRATIYERREWLSEILQRETGKPAIEAIFEILLTADTAAWAAKTVPRVLRTRRSRSHHLAMLRKSIELRWEPYGVVGIICPWNYPLLLSCATLLPALVAGNGVVLKPSELTPGSAEALLEVVRASGLDRELVQCVQGDGSVGQALIESGIDRLFFTGSEATGRKVAAACGERLIPCSLELGGSDPAIVLEDADPAFAAAGITWGRFVNAGQTCVAPKRIFVLAGIYDRFLDELLRAVSYLRVGHSEDRDVGPLIHPRQVRTLREQRNEAVQRDAHRALVVDAKDPSESSVAAEILTDVSDDMRVMREETFGPVLPVVRVESVEEAISRANATSYGLSASVWTGNLRRGRQIARRLEAGTVMVNDVVMEATMPEVAHGGTKASGTGRMHGAIGITEVAQPKTIVVDHFSGWKQAWWFPYTDPMRDGISAFFHLLHGRGLFSRLKAGIRAVRLLYFPPAR